MRLPIVFVVVLFCISILIDWYILRDIKNQNYTRRKKAWRIGYCILSVISYGLLIAVVCIPVRDESSDILPVMWCLYSFLTILIPKMIYFICSLIGKLWRKIFGKDNNIGWHKRNYGAVVGFLAAVAIFVILWWGALFTRREIEVNKVTITSSRLPESFNDYKVVQFSDAHVGTWGEYTTFVAKLVDRINSLNPDVIVFTGDIVNRRTDELRPFLSVLSRLKAKDGVYSILGNHDYGDYIDWKNKADRTKNNELLARWEKEMGWHLLNNEHDFIKRGNDSIVMIGVENWGEPPFPAYGRLKDAYPTSKKSPDNLNDGKFKILLTHNPEHCNREVLNISNIDLSLAGHTHAMQMMVRLGGWTWSPSVFKYSRWGGLYQEKNPAGELMNLYVNIGSGEVGMPSRLLAAYPEITEITLKR